MRKGGTQKYRGGRGMRREGESKERKSKEIRKEKQEVGIREK